MNTPGRLRRLIKRASIAILVLLTLVLAIVVIRCAYAFRDRNPGYSLSLVIDGERSRVEPKPLRAGFARLRINPDLSDPKRPVWLAGFSQHRAATAQHDDLWAIACVLDDGHTRVGVVALDAIGLFHDDVLAVRRRLSPDLKLDYSVICAVHNHSTPDLMGLWGPDYLHTGVDPRYREHVIAAAAKSLADATMALRAARVLFHEIPTPTDGLVTDTRKPTVFDPDLRAMHFTDATNGATLGTIVGWANHPETPWSKNTEITSDFCGYLRDALEKGVVIDGKTNASGFGGIHLYVNGAIGGLITTSPSVTVHDPYLGQDFKEPSHDKARALGHQLAARLLPALSNASHIPGSMFASISVQARTIEIQAANRYFLLAPTLGLVDRGQPRWKRVRTEVALITLGDASIACVPGEIYPEIVNGGIERAPGGDFDIEPLEVPPLRELMPGRVKFVFGLANDEIGYIIPKSEWDEKPPHLYGAKRRVYGEINSVGPDTAAAIHRALRELCEAAKRVKQPANTASLSR